MSNFLNEIKVATKSDCELPWSGNKDNFRCGMCGKKFVPDDEYIIIYTNDMPGAGGNPILCYSCRSSTVDGSRQKWKDHCVTWLEMKKKFWHFLKK